MTGVSLALALLLGPPERILYIDRRGVLTLETKAGAFVHRRRVHRGELIEGDFIIELERSR